MKLPAFKTSTGRTSGDTQAFAEALWSIMSRLCRRIDDHEMSADTAATIHDEASSFYFEHQDEIDAALYEQNYYNVPAIPSPGAFKETLLEKTIAIIIEQMKEGYLRIPILYDLKLIDVELKEAFSARGWNLQIFLPNDDHEETRLFIFPLK